MDYSKKAVLSRHSRIHIWTHIDYENKHRACIYSRQWDSLQRGGSGHMLPPLGNKLSATGSHLQWKHSLHQWGLTPVLTTLDVRPYTQEVAKQIQHNGTFVECLSHSFT